MDHGEEVVEGAGARAAGGGDGGRLHHANDVQFGRCRAGCVHASDRDEVIATPAMELFARVPVTIGPCAVLLPGVSHHQVAAKRSQ